MKRWAIVPTVMVVVLFSGCALDMPPKESSTPEKLAVHNRQPKQELRKTAKSKRNSKPLPAGKKISSNWSRFRGPNGSAVSTDKNIPTEWSATKNMLWKRPLPGRGASSPVTWGGRVYLTCYTGYGLDLAAPGNMANLKRHLLCIDQTDGKVLWKKTMLSKAPVSKYGKTIGLHGYASHTPTVDKSGVYVYYGTTGAAAYSHTGKLHWHKSCGKGTHGYGSAASPILFGDLLIVSANVECGDIIAFSTRNGREVWRAKSTPRIWSTPILVPRGDRHTLICHEKNDRVVGLNPKSGKKLWEFQTFKCGYLTTSPVLLRDAVFITAGGWGNRAIRIGGSGEVTKTHELWRTRGVYGNPVVFNNLLVTAFRIGVNIRDVKTGRTLNDLRLSSGEDGFASPVIASGKLYFVAKSGSTCVVQLGPRPKQVAYNVIAGDTSSFNATPAISNGRLLLRSDKFLYCIGNK